MNTGLLVALMLACGILVAWTPFVCFLFGPLLFGFQGITGSLQLIAFLITIVLTFGLSAASFTYLQYRSCDKITNTKKIFANAGIAAGIQFITLLVVYLTGLTSVPKGVLPAWMFATAATSEGIGYGYFTFFASMFGTVIGGTLSSIC